MKLSHAYLDRVLARLSQVAGISHRRIFTGASLYHQGIQFALVVNDQLYFYTDEHSRLLYQQHGMSPFQPRLAIQLESCFYQVPDAVFNQPAELHHWLHIALENASANQPGEDDNRLDYAKDDEGFNSTSGFDTAFIPQQIRA